MHGAAVGTLAGYETGCVSLPSGQESACDLASVLPGPEDEWYANCCDDMLLDADSVGHVYEDTKAFDNCYHDPAFSDQATWCSSVKELYDAKVTKFGAR